MTTANVVVRSRHVDVGTIGFADFVKRCGYDNDPICMPQFTAIPEVDAVAELIRRAITASRVRRVQEIRALHLPRSHIG
jgi:hypothetical protein